MQHDKTYFCYEPSCGIWQWLKCYCSRNA